MYRFYDDLSKTWIFLFTMNNQVCVCLIQGNTITHVMRHRLASPRNNSLNDVNVLAMSGLRDLRLFTCRAITIRVPQRTLKESFQ